MFVDTNKLSICADPIPAGRAIIKGKYDHLFKEMKPGQAIKCDPDSVQRIRGAMVKFFNVRGIKGMNVKTMRDYGDGMGRVWMLAAPEKKLKAAA